MKLKKHVHSRTSGLFLLLIAFFFVQEAHSQCTVMIDQDFNHWNNRKYSIADAKSDFNNKIKPWSASTYRGIEAPGAVANLIGNVAQETRIVNGTLRAEYKKNDAGGYAGGFLFDPYFDGVEEAYLEYKVKFDDNFFWATGGKLPGLGGSTRGINSETSDRGAIPSGCRYNPDGFSARLMWRRNRAQTNTPYLILYSYFGKRKNGLMRQDGDCGDDYNIFTGLVDDKWYTIRQYIKLNTPGQSNGIVTMWIDGVQTYNMTNALIRKSGKGDVKINALVMNTYRGGSRTDPVWHSPRDEFAFFDDFKVWTGASEPSCGSNQPPTLSFTTPANNATYNIGDDVVVNVAASDSDGSVANVKLYLDNSLVRQENVAPYDWGHQAGLDPELENMSAGMYVLEAVAEDNEGATSSTQITITVNSVNNPPTLSFTTPANNANYDAGDDVIVNVAASDSDGSIANVKLYLDNSLVRQENVAPYDWGHQAGLDPELENMSAGTYVLEAVAEDNEGATSSTQITITVNNSIEGMYRFKNVATGTYLDSDNVNVKVGSSASGADKKWNIVNSAGSYYNIDSEFNGRGVIEALNNGVIQGTSVQPVTTTNRREWTVESLGNNTYRFKNVDQNAYLAANTSTNVVEWTTWNGNRSQWILEPVSNSQDNSVESRTIESIDLEIYPNPVQNHLFIHLAQEEAEAWIYSLDGRLMTQKVLMQGMNEIQRHRSWMDGIYIVKVVSAGEILVTQKILFE